MYMAIHFKKVCCQVRLCARLVVQIINLVASILLGAQTTSIIKKVLKVLLILSGSGLIRRLKCILRVGLIYRPLTYRQGIEHPNSFEHPT